MAAGMHRNGYVSGMKVKLIRAEFLVAGPGKSNTRFMRRDGRFKRV